MVFESSERPLVEIDDTGSAVLWRGLERLIPHGNEGASDGELSSFDVKVFPSQSQYFSSAHACHGSDSPGHRERVRTSELEKS